MRRRARAGRRPCGSAGRGSPPTDKSSLTRLYQHVFREEELVRRLRKTTAHQPTTPTPRAAGATPLLGPAARRAIDAQFKRLIVFVYENFADLRARPRWAEEDVRGVLLATGQLSTAEKNAVVRARQTEFCEAVAALVNQLAPPDKLSVLLQLLYFFEISEQYDEVGLMRELRAASENPAELDRRLQVFRAAQPTPLRAHFRIFKAHFRRVCELGEPSTETVVAAPPKEETRSTTSLKSRTFSGPFPREVSALPRFAPQRPRPSPTAGRAQPKQLRQTQAESAKKMAQRMSLSTDFFRKRLSESARATLNLSATPKKSSSRHTAEPTQLLSPRESSPLRPTARTRTPKTPVYAEVVEELPEEAQSEAAPAELSESYIINLEVELRDHKQYLRIQSLEEMEEKVDAFVETHGLNERARAFLVETVMKELRVTETGGVQPF